jgi:MFS transporter, ACS family, hexuronate transporter
MLTAENAVDERSFDAERSEASRRRWFVLGLLLAVTIINFIDRQTVSVLAPILRQVLHLSNSGYGRIVSAFQFGMMSAELPMGALMDQWGVRLGLTGAVIWWSSATAFQAFARSGTQLGITRFWMGTGECGNYSGGIKAVFQLFSQKERTLAIGIFNGGSMIGATIATPVIIYLAVHFGYQKAFLVSSCLGFLWAPLWWFTYRERPSDLISSSPRVPIIKLLGDSSAWAVMLCRFFIGPVMQFYWYWIPSYLYSVRHMSLLQIGVFAWIPFLFGDIGGVAGGWAAGWLQSRGVGTYNVRRITMYSSSALCVASLGVPYVRGATAAFVLIGIAMLADNFLSANMFGSVIDLFPEHTVGRATGLTGVAGGLSGLLFPILTGVLVDKVSYAPVFLLIAFMPLLGTASLFLFSRRFHALAEVGKP